MNAKLFIYSNVLLMTPLSIGLLVSLLMSGCNTQNNEDSSPLVDLPFLDLSIKSACNDELDNDLDELIDFPADPGCQSINDIDERDPIINTACNDLLDNDNDGLIDFNDPGCLESEGEQEEHTVSPPQCSNGLDDDGDGYVDFPIDDSCLSPTGDDESYVLELTACNNQRDDDADGLIDFPYDPGCASVDDLDERDDISASMIAQCNDNIDNDLDGYTDMADPQCATPADPRERPLDNEAIAICSNGIDDDEDGLVDAYEDPGCLGPGAASEVDGDALPACADGLDNDADGYIDYPDDPGCSSLGMMDESDPQVAPACLDGVDNDEDGYIDFPIDIGCDSSSDHSEEGFCLNTAEVIELNSGQVYRGSSRQGRFLRQGQCGGRGAPELTALFHVHKRIRKVSFKTQAIQGQEDTAWETTLYARRRCDEELQELACHREEIDQLAYNELVIDDPPLGPLYLLIDGASGRGGTFELSVEATAIEACQNQIDDDSDGFIDFPYDPGCQSFIDEDETNPAPLPQCANQLDDDQDNLIDFPNDIGCRAAFDHDELDECGQGVPVYHFPFGTETFTGYSTREGNSSESVGSCGGLGIEQVIRYDNPSHARLEFELYRTDGIIEPVYLYARSWSCSTSNYEVGCAVDNPGDIAESNEDEDLSLEMMRYGFPLTLELTSVPQGPLYLFVDHDLEGLPFILKVKRTPLTPICSDQTDNDQDGLIDAEDPGCQGPNDEDERDPDVLSICADGIDNDEDGWTDYPLDIGCAFYGGQSEEDPQELPSCSNGIDDNGDGYTDFPYDIGCAARGDNTEANLPIAPECANLRDDDENGLIDFPDDPGCVAHGDAYEFETARSPHCSDGLDNDQNGFIDYPLDPGCYAAGDPKEQPTDRPSACSDGVDNDQDGFIDLPYDPGCLSSGDDNEMDPLIPPQCSNGVDDDQNNRTDWPDDPGCLSRADPREDAVGSTKPRCGDGVDNDDDGHIDLMDLDCTSRLDPTEQPDLDQPSTHVEDPQCADLIDNDGDARIDWPNDVGCAARGDFCENGGYHLCPVEEVNTSQISECIDLLTHNQHCGACGQACPSNSECIQGQCTNSEYTLRPRLMNCGITLRSLNEFLIGPLQDQVFITNAGCDPDDSVQALLVSRSGSNGIAVNLNTIKTYLERGGIVVTEQNIGARIYSKIFDVPTFDQPQLGNCGSNIQPLVVHRPTDPIWSLVAHTPPSDDLSGCGDDLHRVPGLIRLGGWDHLTTSIGYRNYGKGRLWLLASNWRDPNPNMTDESRALMAAIISGASQPRLAPNLPECMDRIDNDQDGYIDLFDTDCTSSRDVTEWPITSQLFSECSDHLDNDEDGYIDFPYDVGCSGAGDFGEDDLHYIEGRLPHNDLPSHPQCSDGLDNDLNGWIDWPWDQSCSSRGDQSEDGITDIADCNNLQDDDEDGYIDFPADPDCLAFTWPYEVPLQRIKLYPHAIALDLGIEINSSQQWNLGCSNLADDDGDGLVDYPADPNCESPHDSNEWEGEPLLSLSERLKGFMVISECLDGLDNDFDGDVDLADTGCLGVDDVETEDEQAEVLPACGDLIDNDEDGRVDWPEDTDCTASGQNRESNCMSNLSISIDQVLTVAPLTSSSEEDAEWQQIVNINCGLDQPEHFGRVVSYLHQDNQPVRLSFDRVISTENEPFMVKVGLQRACGEQAQTMMCREVNLSSQSDDERSITLRTLPQGQYFITLNAISKPSWESHSLPINLPADPENYIANDDITSICWQDGGRDSFDCMGRAKITWDDTTISLNVAMGIHTLRLSDHLTLHYSSDKPHSNIWRLRFWTNRVVNQSNTFSLEFYGNLGLNRGTLMSTGQKILDGTAVPYWWYTDHVDRVIKPPILSFIVPAYPQEVSSIQSTLSIDQVSHTISNVRLPLTYYLVTSYLPLDNILSAIENDLDLNDGRTYSAILPEEVTLTIETMDAQP